MASAANASDHVHGHVGAPRLLSMSYEEMFAAPLASARRVFAFLGVPACDISLERTTRRLGLPDLSHLTCPLDYHLVSRIFTLLPLHLSA